MLARQQRLQQYQQEREELMANKKPPISVTFTNRSYEDICYDILGAIVEKKNIHPYSFLSNKMSEPLTGGPIRKSKNGVLYDKKEQVIEGAILTHVLNASHLSSKLLKRYLAEMYAYGLIELGVYSQSIYVDRAKMNDHKNHKQLLHITEKGMKYYKLVYELRELVREEREVEN